MWPRPTSGANGLTLTTTRSMQLDAVVGELLELLGDVAAGEDPGVDRGMEGPDLAADERRHRGQVGDGRDLDPVRGEVLARAVGGEHLHAEALQLARERGDALAVGHREQRTHLLGSSSGVRSGAPFAPDRGRIRAAPGGHVRRRVYRGPVAYSDGPSRAGRAPAASETTRVTLWPWEYLFKPFSAGTSRTCTSSSPWRPWSLLIATVIFYNVRTRQLHRHSVYLQMYEWLLWTGVIVFGLMLVYCIFHFDWIIVLSTLVVGLGTWSGSGSSASRRTSGRTSASSRSSATSRASGSPAPRRRSAPSPRGAAGAADRTRPGRARPEGDRCRSRSAGSGSVTGVRTGRPGHGHRGPGHRERAGRAHRGARLQPARADHARTEPELDATSS